MIPDVGIAKAKWLCQANDHEMERIRGIVTGVYSF
jgi:hypothetical protein